MALVSCETFNNMGEVTTSFNNQCTYNYETQQSRDVCENAAWWHYAYDFRGPCKYFKWISNGLHIVIPYCHNAGTYRQKKYISTILELKNIPEYIIITIDHVQLLDDNILAFKLWTIILTEAWYVILFPTIFSCSTHDVVTQCFSWVPLF